MKYDSPGCWKNLLLPKARSIAKLPIVIKDITV